MTSRHGSGGLLARLFGAMILAAVGCAESAAPESSTQLGTPVSLAEDEELISFRVAGFVKAMGIT